MRKHRFNPEKILEFKEGPNFKAPPSQDSLMKDFDQDVLKLIELQSSWEESEGPLVEKVRWLSLKAQAQKIRSYIDEIDTEILKAA